MLWTIDLCFRPCEKNNIYIVTYGEGNGNPLQYTCLENPVDRGALWAAAYGVPQDQTQLKRCSINIVTWGNGTHSSPLAWKIPWTEDPGRLQSMGSQRVGYDWATPLTHSLTHAYIILVYNWKLRNNKFELLNLFCLF